jgi:hypothetical protein
MKSAKGAQGLQRTHKEMHPRAKRQLVFRQFNGELIDSDKSMRTKKCFHIMKPGFIT